jgi:alpha-beta hydrolase superfamily lysophospholipase
MKELIYYNQLMESGTF